MKSIARQKTDSLKEKLIQTYPVLKKKPDMEFWVFDGTASSTQIEKQENMIRTAAPDYSYEEMDYDHQLTEYESTETNPPVFKMALEYTGRGRLYRPPARQRSVLQRDAVPVDQHQRSALHGLRQQYL